jgi:uncharacterized protein YqgC (DUF456 family)
MSQAPTVIATVPHDFDVLTQAEYQEKQADQLLQGVFGSEENAEKTGNLITHFVSSYEQHKHDMPLDQWLMQEFRQYPTLWASPLELETTAREIILTVEANNAAKTALYEHLDKGKSRESWIAKRIEESAKAAGITNVEEYAAQVYAALQQTNQSAAESLLDKNDAIKSLFQLDGKTTLPPEWNDVSRIDFSKLLDKESRRNATINAAKQGARILGRRAWNWLTGKKNPPASEDLREFFESSLKSAEHIGVQAAVSGGMVVAVKQGFVNGILKNTPIAPLVNMVTTGMEKAKILYKFSKGELSAADALEAMAGNTIVSAISGFTSKIMATKGASIGAYIGSVFGPPGMAVGGLVGGIVGNMAGNEIGKTIYEGGKNMVNAAVSGLKSVAASVGRVASTVASKVSGFFSKVFG